MPRTNPDRSYILFTIRKTLAMGWKKYFLQFDMDFPGLAFFTTIAGHIVRGYKNKVDY